MKFSTPVPVIPCPEKISHKTPVLMLGSCFSDYIGSLMGEECFPIITNPFGVLYNPFSIALLLKRSLNGNKIEDEDIFEEGGIFRSFLFHSSFAAIHADELKAKASESLTHTSDFVKRASFLIITLGTARYYRHVKTGEIVANCHKQPRNVFTEVLATPEACAAEISDTINALRVVNPDLFVVFTISPVRYMKDGAPGAQQDKAALFVALQQWLNLPGTYYFPAYEILVDELRDYRFYANDMVHPSPLATDYIYKKFGEAFFSEETQKLSARLKCISLTLRHRPGIKESPAYRELMDKTKKEIGEIKRDYPYLKTGWE
jgi:hypothetical protein